MVLMARFGEGQDRLESENQSLDRTEKWFDFVPQPPKITKSLEPSSKNGFSAVALPSPTFLTPTPNNLSLSFSLRHNE